MASHCLLLELCGGLISRNFKVLADAADEHAASIASRLADLESSQVGRPADLQSSRAAPDGLEAAAVAQALRMQELAEEAGKQCHNTLRFLGQADSLRRLIAVRVLLEPFRELKSEVLRRSGGEWEVEQQRLAIVGGRRYAVPTAACGREVLRAQASLTELLVDLTSASWCLARVGGTSAEESQRRWRMAARAGAALHRMMAVELQTYPWRLFKLILSDGQTGAAEFEADARSCDRLCFLDPLAALHWQKFPSVPELLGAESVAHLQAMAIIAKDNISHVERQHATGRREAFTREQTHLELLCDSSAAHVLRNIRAKHSGVALSRAAPAAVKRCAAQKSTGKDQGVKRTQRRRQLDNRAIQKKGRRVDRFNAWVSVHVSGRLVSVADRARYRESMRDPAQQAHFDNLAAVLTAARSLRGGRKRPPRPGEHTLRRRRENAKRTRQPWNPREARVTLEQERVSRFHMVRASRESELRRRRGREREEQHKHQADIAEFRKREGSTLQGLGFPQAVMDDLVQEPHSVHGLGEGAHSPFAARCYAWHPKDATATALYDVLPGAMQHESLQRVTAWQRDHLVLTGGPEYRIPRESDWEKTRRMCVKHRRCLCTVAAAPFLALAAALSSAIFRFMRIVRGRKPMPPKYEERLLVEAGRVVLELHSPKEHLWFLLAHQCFDIGGLPVFLHVRPAHEASVGGSGAADGAGHVTANDPRASQAVGGDLAASQVVGGDPGVSQVAGGDPAPSHIVGGHRTIRVEAVTMRTEEGSRVGRWVAAMDVLEELDLRAEWRTRFWSVVGDSSVCALTLMAQSKDELFWRGARDIARAETNPHRRPPADSEGSEEEDERDDGNLGSDTEVACGSEKSEELPGAAQGDSDIDAFAARAKRQTRGVTFHCVASRRAGHEALTFMLTHRPANSKKRAGFQATCHHHEADVLLNKNNKPYQLPCRRTVQVCGDTAADEKAAIASLLRWVRMGPCFVTRADHQATDMATSSSSTSSEGGGESTTTPAGKPKELPRVGGPVDARAAQRSGGPAVSQTDQSFAGPAPSRASEHGGSPVVSQTARSSGKTPAPQILQCWLCGEPHEEATCHIYNLLFFGTQMHKYGKGFIGPAGVVGQDGLVLPLNKVQTKQVPGDGNCLFHAIGRELTSALPAHIALPRSPNDGQSWRQFLLDYVVSTSDCLSGRPVQEWVTVTTSMDLETYVATMSAVHGRESWGGFLEVSLLLHAWKQHVAPVGLGALLFERVDDGYKAMTWIGDQSEGSKTIFAVWTGSHWDRARVRPAGFAPLRAWAQR